jgi:putative zinc finger/helix-turn-helix YgiT family protein
MVESRENIRYEECGLPYVTLRNIMIERCPECGNELVTIPKVAELHRVLALTLIRKPGRLDPLEITILRKSLGWSKADFARKIHVHPSQVSRWESITTHTPMGEANDLLLRTLVAMNQEIRDYMEEMDKIDLGQQPHVHRRLSIEMVGRKWLMEEGA